jgi:hypothetical protein
VRRALLSPLTAAILLTAAVSGSGITGSWRTGLYFTDPGIPDSSSRYILESPVRLMYRRIGGDLDIQAALVLAPSIGNPALEEADLEAQGAFRIGDPHRVLMSTSGDNITASLCQDMDRLSIGLRTSLASFTAGRQAVYWGVARSVSPTDFIAPFRYGAIDTEYRMGVDAFRAVFPLGMLSELDAGVALGEDGEFGRSALWLRGRFYVLKTDASLLVARTRDNLLIGGSLNRTIGGGTGWVEAAVVEPGRFREDMQEDPYLSLSLGYDRSWFGASLYGYLEYHFSSPGSDEADDYAEVQTGAPFLVSGVYLLGRHYICPGITWNPAPLWTLSSSALASITDGSCYLSLSGEYGIGQNTAFQGGGNLGLGKEPARDGTLESEFGSWPDLLYLRVAYYF